MNTNDYDAALRGKIRFESCRGDLTLEQLWDVPLRSRNGFDLDAVAKAANQTLKGLTEESFVNTRKNPAETEAVLRLDFVKYVIEVKLEEAEAARKRADLLKKKEKLIEALDEKQNDALKNMSEDDLKKQLAELEQ